jgi:hypothetical protein
MARGKSFVERRFEICQQKQKLAEGVVWSLPLG